MHAFVAKIALQLKAVDSSVDSEISSKTDHTSNNLAAGKIHSNSVSLSMEDSCSFTLVLSVFNTFPNNNYYLGHCYYFLCFSSPVRVAFSENTKKKKLNSKSTKLLPARARSHSSLLASCMTRRLKTAKPTRIKGEPLSGGGMDDENSEGELF